MAVRRKPPAADPAPRLDSDGPGQNGRAKQGQYVYLIVFSRPASETVQRLRLKTPADFSKTQFRDLALQCHTAHGVDLVETAAFVEPHVAG